MVQVSGDSKIQNLKLFQKWFKIQSWLKIESRSGVCVQTEWQKYTSSSPPFCKVEELRDMSITWVSKIVWSVQIHISLIVTVYYKTRQVFLQNATAILLQNATEVYYIIHQDFYYKMWQFYYKIQQVLQISTISLQNATVITKCDIYYKLRLYTWYWYSGWTPLILDTTC